MKKLLVPFWLVESWRLGLGDDRLRTAGFGGFVVDDFQRRSREVTGTVKSCKRGNVCSVRYNHRHRSPRWLLDAAMLAASDQKAAW